jgi:hypothetical protein
MKNALIPLKKIRERIFGGGGGENPPKRRNKALYGPKRHLGGQKCHREECGFVRPYKGQ